MVQITRLNGETYFLNPHQIEIMERTPDTIITLASGRKIVVKDTVEQLMDRIIEYRRRLGPMTQEF